MRSIDTVHKGKVLTGILLACFLSAVACGCQKKEQGDFDKAGRYLKKSEAFLKEAEARYQELIRRGKDTDRARLELGKLYSAQGDFERAREEFQKCNDPAALKLLAISCFRMGDFTAALAAFRNDDAKDAESVYYYGLTCERLNLFDEALALYRKIEDRQFADLARQRIEAIERQGSPSARRTIQEIDPAVHQVIAAAPAQSDYPQAGALILRCDEKVEITPDNTQVSHLRYLIKVLNERGKEDFSEAQVDYDSTYDRVELEYARTIQPDGTVIDVGRRHIRDVSKYLNFPLYSNARVYIISFPGVTEGACIEYKIRIYRSELINKKDFITAYSIQASEPIIDARFSIDVPKEKTLYMKVLNEKYNTFGAALKPEILLSEGHLIYAWKFQNIPQIMPEPSMPPNVKINPAVLISTFTSWQEVYAWWWALAREKIKADAEIRKQVQELTRDASGDEQKARALYNFCARKIRYVAVEYGQAGYEPHQAEDILRNRYGDCKDQAILLVTMLREAGLSAWPVLISTKGAYDLQKDFPSLLFNHCIAAVVVQGSVIFLDPTAETCSFGDLPPGDEDRRVLVFHDDGYKIQETPFFPAGHNLLRHHLKITIRPDETVAAEKTVVTRGIYDQGQRMSLLYTAPELIEAALKEEIQDISIGATLGGYKIDNLDNLDEPVLLRYDFSGTEYFTAAERLRIMPQLTGLDTSLVARSSRRYPIDFSIPDVRETELEVAIPEGFIVKHMPQDVAETSPWLKFTASYAFEDNTIYFKERAELLKTEIGEHEYAGFKKFFEDLAQRLKQNIVLEKTK